MAHSAQGRPPFFVFHQGSFLGGEVNMEQISWCRDSDLCYKLIWGTADKAGFMKDGVLSAAILERAEGSRHKIRQLAARVKTLLVSEEKCWAAGRNPMHWTRLWPINKEPSRLRRKLRHGNVTCFALEPCQGGQRHYMLEPSYHQEKLTRPQELNHSS